MEHGIRLSTVTISARDANSLADFCARLLDWDAALARLRATSCFARFPGPHGRVYRLLVIDSRAHVVATRGLLASIRSQCLTR